MWRTGLEVACLRVACVLRISKGSCIYSMRGFECIADSVHSRCKLRRCSRRVPERTTWSSTIVKKCLHSRSLFAVYATSSQIKTTFISQSLMSGFPGSPRVSLLRKAMSKHIVASSYPHPLAHTATLAKTDGKGMSWDEHWNCCIRPFILRDIRR